MSLDRYKNATQRSLMKRRGVEHLGERLADSQVEALYSVKSTPARMAYAAQQLASYRKFVKGMQDELPGWRPSNWDALDEEATFGSVR